MKSRQRPSFADRSPGGETVSDYRRWFVKGGTYFFTVVTYGRRRILTSEPGRRFLRESVRSVQDDHPFRLIATVLLPDHWHLVMQLPQGDDGYSPRMQLIKRRFTERWLGAGLSEARVTESQRRRNERGVWQVRFWEHSVRDAQDLEHCCDYVHWNPRKHDLVTRVSDWPWSSFHRFVAEGWYPADWGGVAPRSLRLDRDWGEP